MPTQERIRALAMLACAFVPLCFELAAGRYMVSAVEWNVIVFVFLYAAFCFEATSYRCTSSAKMEVCRQCAKVGLFLAVAYSWLSFLHGMQDSIVKCLLVDLEGAGDSVEATCREGGFRRGCVRAVKSLNELNKVATNCPQFKLGYFIGNVYTVVVLCFRGFAVGVVGIWNLYSWDPARFRSGGSSDEAENGPGTPSSKHMYVLLLCLLPCVVVEVAVPDILPLSTVGATAVQLAVFGLQQSIKSSPKEEAARNALIAVQKVLACTAAFYALLEFVLQSLSVIYTCAPMSVREQSVTATCAGAVTHSEVEKCYSLIQDMQPVSPASSERCPQGSGSSAASVTLYLANVSKVVLLTVGNSLVFLRRTGRKR